MEQFQFQTIKSKSSGLKYLYLSLLTILICFPCGKTEIATNPLEINQVLEHINKILNDAPTQAMLLLGIETTHSVLDWANYISSERVYWPQSIFTNALNMPRRNSYFPYQKVSPMTMGKFLPSYLLVIVFVTPENFNDTSNPALQNVTRVDYDLFIVLGEEKLLREYFRTEYGMKLRNRLGVIVDFNQSYINPLPANAPFLVDPEIYSDGEMNLSLNLPESLKFSLNGRSLRVSANTLAPYIVFISPNNITGGTHYMMLMLSATSYNFTLIWDINPTRGNGKLAKDGSASGMLGDVLNGNADIAFIARLTLGQIGVIDLTTSNYVDTLVFVTRNPEVHLKWTAVIQLFTIETWGIILLIFIALIPLYYIKLQRASNSYLQPTVPFKAFTIPFGILITQSVPHIPERAYPLTFFWMIFVLNMNAAYNSNLSSFLTKLEPDLVPHSFEDLATRLDYNVSFNYLNNGSCDCFHFFNDSTNPMIISIKERFMHHLEPDTGRCIVRAIVKSKNVCIGWESVTMIGIAQNATLYGGLKLVKVSHSVHSSRNSIGFQRHSVYTQTFDRIFGWFRDMGVVIYLKREAEAAALVGGQTWIKSRKDSRIYRVLRQFVNNMHVNVRPFELIHFKFAYLLLIGGGILSVVIFFMEHMTSANIRKKSMMIEYSP